MPFDADAVLIVDPATGIADTTSLPVTPGGSSLNGKWIGGALADNGKIYACPYSSSTLLIIDPSTNSVNSSIGGFTTYDGGWHGAVFANDAPSEVVDLRQVATGRLEEAARACIDQAAALAGQKRKAGVDV